MRRATSFCIITIEATLLLQLPLLPGTLFPKQSKIFRVLGNKGSPGLQIPTSAAFGMDEQNYAEMVVPDTSEDDSDRNDKDIDPLPSHKIGSSKLGNASMSGNASKLLKEGVKATKSNMMEGKKRSKRLWSQNDELVLVNGFGRYHSLHPNNEMSFHSFIKDSVSFKVSVNQLTDKLWKVKKKYEESKSRRMKDCNNLGFDDFHQQKLFEASSKIWERNSNLIKRGEVREEGRKEDKCFYHSLLRNYVGDKGVDFATLDPATRCIFVEEWNNLMLAQTYHLTLNAKFDKKVCKCKHLFYKADISSSSTLEGS